MSQRFPYQLQPLGGVAPPSLAPGTTHRFRPYLPIQIRSLQSGRYQVVQRALLDTGADDTVFPESLGVGLGIVFLPSTAGSANLRWRGGRHPIRFADVELEITDKITTCTWRAVVAFTTAQIPYPLLGQAGFLQYFNQTGRGEDRETVLEPVPSFPGAVA